MIELMDYPANGLLTILSEPWQIRKTMPSSNSIGQ